MPRQTACFVARCATDCAPGDTHTPSFSGFVGRSKEEGARIPLLLESDDVTLLYPIGIRPRAGSVGSEKAFDSYSHMAMPGGLSTLFLMND